MEAKTKRKRKKHAEAFKIEAVRLLESRGDRTVADVAASVGVSESQLHAWKSRYGSAAEQVRKERGGETAEEELKRLRLENAQLKQERDTLKNRAATLLRIAAVNVGRTATALGAFYRRLAARTGKAKAVTATARKLAVLLQRRAIRLEVHRPGRELLRRTLSPARASQPTSQGGTSRVRPRGSTGARWSFSCRSDIDDGRDGRGRPVRLDWSCC